MVNLMISVKLDKVNNLVGNLKQLFCLPNCYLVDVDECIEYKVDTVYIEYFVINYSTGELM